MENKQNFRNDLNAGVIGFSEERSERDLQLLTKFSCSKDKTENFIFPEPRSAKDKYLLSTFNTCSTQKTEKLKNLKSENIDNLINHR